MAEEDLESRTEEPTPRRREQARDEGRAARSVEVTAATVLLTGILALSQFGPETAGALREEMRRSLLGLSATDLTPGQVGEAMLGAASVILTATAPIVLAMAIAGTASVVAQVGFGLYPKLLLPKLSRISPGNGFSRIFSRRGLVDLVKSVAKIGLVSWVAWTVVFSDEHRLAALGLASPREILSLGGAELVRLLLWVGSTLAALASLDYLWQRRSHQQGMRMTRQEVKEELRQSEGDPKLKQRMKRAYRDLTGNRMLSEVANADVVVTNPTHFAVALRYRAGENGAPKVVAKGVDEVAERIKQLARAAGVPIVERRSLARALFRGVKVGSEIPANLYRAVAEVLAYIYGLESRKAV